jgi:glycine/D-amino acid oxidase-like deaminating enzyme
MARWIVVGAGIIGLSVARELARAGVDVTVLEARTPGSQTSSTSFAWVNASQKVPDPYFRLNLLGMHEHERLAGGSAPWWRRNGHLRWARPGEEADHLAAVTGEMDRVGYPVEVVSRARALELEPGLILPESVGSLAYFPTEGHCYPALLLGRMLSDLRAHGGQVQALREVASVRPGPTGARVVLTDGEVLRADGVVVCAGRWTQDLLATAGAYVPLQPVTGPGSPPVSFLAVTSPVPSSLDRLLTTPFLNVRPDGGGRLLLQAPELDVDADPAAVPSLTSPVAAELLARLRRSLRDTDGARLESLVVGWRVLPGDRQTVAGFVDGDRTLYVIATHSGVTLSPLLGRLAREEITTGQDAPVLEPFRPSRFAGGVDPPDPWLVRAAGVQ